MSWDPRAERITARAQAERARAEADVVRLQAEMEARRERAEIDQHKRDHKRASARKRRQELAKTLRRHGGKAVPTAAIGAPAVIAWNGQYQFADQVMHLGVLSPLLPVAIEGSVLYSAMLAHQAIDEDKPAGRYRVMTWALAAVAAAMNCWHGIAGTGGAVTTDDAQVGAALGLTSLLGIALLEATTALRQRAASGRTAAEIRRALVRRIRYPRLSMQAAAIAAARGIGAEEAWRAAWVDRYGIGPDSTRRERRTARGILAQQARMARRAARTGVLTISDEKIGWASRPSMRSAPMSGRLRWWFGRAGRGRERPYDDQMGAQGIEDERSAPLADEPPEVRETVIREWAAAGIEEFERFLSAQAGEPGNLLELPPARSDEHESERPDERSHGSPDERPGERRNDAQMSGNERRTAHPGRRADRRKMSGLRGRSERLESVRRLLAERPELTGAQIAIELGIPASTARRLAARVRREGGDR